MSNNRRYIDALCSFNCETISDHIKKIYPSELVVNRENKSDHKASFLDLMISIDNDSWTTDLYDKRKDFNFSIVNYPFLDGNIPKRIGWSVLVSQLIRYSRVCDNVTSFASHSSSLLSKLSKQSFSDSFLLQKLKIFVHKYQEQISKYSSSTNNPDLFKKNLVIDIWSEFLIKSHHMTITKKIEERKKTRKGLVSIRIENKGREDIPYSS